MSTPDLDSIAEEAMDGVENLETPQVEDQPAVQETEEQPQAQEVKTEETQDSFTERFDPKTLTGKELQVYKMLQADYTKKRQNEKEELKQLKAENEQLKKGNPQPTQEQAPRGTREEIKEVIREEKEAEWDRDAQTSYPTLDDRLNEDDPLTYDPLLDTALRAHLTEELDAHIEKSGTKLGFDYKKAARSFIEKWDEHIENLNKSYMQKKTQQSKENAEKLKKQTPEVKNPKSEPSGKMSLDDAIDSALGA